MVVSIFGEIRLKLPVGCDYLDYCKFFRSSYNRYIATIAKYFAKTIIAITIIAYANNRENLGVLTKYVPQNISRNKNVIYIYVNTCTYACVYVFMHIQSTW
jgi:hypothetical protein